MMLVELTYTASIYARIVHHNRSVVEDDRAESIETAAIVCRRVILASDVVEDNRAIFIPPENLDRVTSNMRSSTFDSSA